MGVKNLLGERVKKFRKLRGYTQEQFAEMIDITPRNLSRIELGTSFVTAETLDKILMALNVDADTLFSYVHLKEDRELLAEIYGYLDKIKGNSKQLQKAYRFLKLISSEDL